MMRSGLVSATFRHLSPARILRLAGAASLHAIEWSGDIHVPPGDVGNARKVKDLTLKSGLSVAAYGSYYRIGQSESEGLCFAKILATAEVLETRIVRVWAGNRNAEDAEPDYRQKIADESRRIADAAARKNIKIVYEFHGGTLTNTAKSCRELLEKVNHENVRTYWQPISTAGVEENLAGLDTVLPFVAGVHVFHWFPKHNERHLLSVGADNWAKYIARLKNLAGFALLEFVKDDRIENFQLDADALRRLLVGSETKRT